MKNCIKTTLKSSVSIEHAEYIDYLRIPVKESTITGVYAYRFNLQYSVENVNDAFIIGDGYFTDTSHTNKGKIAAVNTSNKTLYQMYSNGNYDLYVDIHNIKEFTSINPASGVRIDFSGVDYNRLMAYNKDTLTRIYFQSESDLFSVVNLIKDKCTTRIVKSSGYSFADTVSNIIDLLEQPQLELRIGYQYDSKTDYYGTITGGGSLRGIKITSKTHYEVYSDNGTTMLYQANLVNGEWVFSDPA